jgi:hypothetical protein
MLSAEECWAALVRDLFGRLVWPDPTPSDRFEEPGVEVEAKEENL